jgi:hypothetical protein
MLASLIPIRLAGQPLAGGVLIILVSGCAGDDLLLPRDGAPAELRVVSGDEQSAPVGAPVDHPLVVQALDGARRPVPGAGIVFEFVDPPNGAELAPATTETDTTGRASAEVTLGTPAGDQSVEARLNDPASDLKVQFRLTALQRNGGGGDEGGDGDGDGGGGDGGGGGDDGGGGGGDGDDEGNGGGGRGGQDGGGDVGGDDDGDGGGDDGGNGGGAGPDDDGDDSDNGKGKGKGNGKGNGKGKGNGD